MTSLLNKKIPTIVGLLLLAVAVLTTSYLVNTGVILFGGAAPSENPQNVKFTNVSDTSFTVTYKTDAKVIGTISLETNTTQTVLDERDQQSGVPKLYNLHSIAVKNAKPLTTYLFSITSGSSTYQNNGNLFSIKTGATPTGTPSATTPLTGKLISANGNVPDEALVFVTTQNGQQLSSLTKQNGLYLIPLNNMLMNDLSTRLSLTSSSILQVLATDGTSVSQVQVPLSGTNPVPLITLGDSYNFVTSTIPIASTAASLGFPPFPQDNSLTATPVIITPKKDQGFTDNQPQFRGTALPNQSVTIEIHSDDKITATTTTDSSGNWTYRPTVALSPGQHTLIITTKDQSGILRTIEQSFTVFASGSQVTQSATPSGQLSPTPTAIPTQIPTITQTVSITPAITQVSTPTTSPIQIVTATPSVIKPKPTLPPTGSNTLVTTSVLGIVTTVIGIVLFVLTKGATL